MSVKTSRASAKKHLMQFRPSPASAQAPLVTSASGAFSFDLTPRRDHVTPEPYCVIVEDQVLIGMALEVSLEEAGFAVTGLFVSNTQALQWLEHNRPDLAVLDVMILDGTCLRIARELKHRGVPFAIYSGLPPKADCPPELRDAPWLEKPVSREILAKTLAQLVPPLPRGSQPMSCSPVAGTS
jgi:CheY-like chemotaxis protein